MFMLFHTFKEVYKLCGFSYITYICSSSLFAQFLVSADLWWYREEHLNGQAGKHKDRGFSLKALNNCTQNE